MTSTSRQPSREQQQPQKAQKHPPAPAKLTAEQHQAQRDAAMARRIPKDTSAEAAVIGSMIIDPQVIGPVCMFLKTPDAFFQEENQIVFSVIVELFEKNKKIDAMILHSALRDRGLLEQIGGIEYLKVLANAVPTSAHAEFYAAMVKEKYQRRQLITRLTASLRESFHGDEPFNQLADRVEQRIFEIQEPATMGAIQPAADVIHQVFEQLEGGGQRGLETGLIEIDNLTCGLQKGDLIIVAARPSVGKTAYAMGIAEHVSVNKKIPTLVFSLEMSKQALMQRMLCSRSGVDSHKLRRGMLSREDRERLSYAVGELSGAELWIDDTPGLTLMDFRTKARRIKLQKDIQLIVLDYMQLMECPGRSENRQQEITTISRGIKAIARELNVPVLCLSQLNRASESENRMPRTSDLRESGSIEQDADVVMLLHREAVLHRGDQEWMDANPDKINEAIVNIAKQRMGPCDIVKLVFLSHCTRFVNQRNSGM